MNELGELVRSYRKFEGLTQEELAYNVGRSVATISRIENGTPVGAYSLELVLRELSIPVFCSVFSVEYSKIIEIKREMLTALYCNDREWYASSYKEYTEYDELEGVMGEMYAEYFKVMYDYMTEGGSDELSRGLIETLDKIAPVKAFIENLEKQRRLASTERLERIAYFRGLVRRGIRKNGSEIDVLLINGIGNSLLLRKDYSGAEVVFEELIYESRRREGVFEERHSNVPTLCYNLSLCYFLEGKRKNAVDVLKYARKTYQFKDNLRLELKYQELEDIYVSYEDDASKISPIFSFPKPIYWYTISTEIKNLKNFSIKC